MSAFTDTFIASALYEQDRERAIEAQNERAMDAPCGLHEVDPELERECPYCAAEARAERGWAAYEMDHEAELGGL